MRCRWAMMGQPPAQWPRWQIGHEYGWAGISSLLAKHVQNSLSDGLAQ